MSDDNTSDDQTSTAGWDAITGALTDLYGREPDHHLGTVISYRLGGPDPLDGISVYKVGGEGPPHWHIVTHGFTELFDKGSDYPEVSGWGFEFTMRLACDAKDDSPPMWVMNFLQNIARYVFESGNVFGVNQNMDANGPLASEEETSLTAFLVARPPKLPHHVDSENGAFEFLHIVGITADELEALQLWSTAGVVALMQEQDSMLLTDLSRACSTDDPAFVDKVKEGAKREGSSSSSTYVDALDIKSSRGKRTITLGAIVAQALLQRLPVRLPFSRSYELVGANARLLIEPSEDTKLTLDEGQAKLLLSEADLDALLETLKVEQGTYSIPGLPKVQWVVTKTEIRDGEGKVVDTLG